MAAVAASAFVLAGCAAAGANPSSAPSAQSGQAGQGGQNRQGGGQGGMGGRTSGLIAEIDGKTLQVQTGSEQVAVSYTSKTTFAQRVDGKLTDVKTGSCVMVRSADTVDQNGGTVAATSIDVSTATGDSCGMGMGGGPGMGGARPSGAPSGMPSGGPSGMPQDGGPSGAPGGGRTGGMVVGTVTKIDGGTLTVSAQRQDAKATYTVTTTADTTVTAEEATTAKAAKVGLCLTAQGQPDSTGAVSATAITLRKAIDGACTTRGGR